MSTEATVDEVPAQAAVEQTAGGTEQATEAVAQNNEDNNTATKEAEPTTAEDKAESTEGAAADAAVDVAETEVKKPNILKTTAKVDKKDYSKNSKFNPADQPVTDDHNLIRSQVEFYFGDHNLPTDKYLWGLTDGTSNKPVPLKNICKFKRMQRFQPYEAVVAALKESYLLEVEGKEGEETVRRKIAYSPQDSARRAKRDQATVYVKGFGDETPTTQFELEGFFAPFGDCAAVRLRRTEEKLFKGSVFVEFKDEAQAKAFLELDPPPKWQDHDLKIMSKQDYVAEKMDLIKNGEMTPNNSRRPPKFYEGRGGSKKFGSHDKDDWKKRREHDQKNGFKDHHSGRGRGRGRGRGHGHGRGRGGRSQEDRPQKVEEPVPESVNDVRPQINSSAPESASNGHSKRRRDDEAGPAEEPAAKKAAVAKEEVAA